MCVSGIACIVFLAHMCTTSKQVRIKSDTNLCGDHHHLVLLEWAYRVLCCRCPVGVVGPFIGNTRVPSTIRAHSACPGRERTLRELWSRCSTLPFLSLLFLFYTTLHSLFHHSWIHANTADIPAATPHNIFDISSYLLFSNKLMVSLL